MSAALGLLKLTRPRQWVKNLLVIVAPLLTNGPRALEDSRLWVAVLAFTSISAAVYCLNDLADAEVDAKHPRKRFRPVASGVVSKKSALLLASVLVCAAMVAGYVTGSYGWIGLYFIVNVVYSKGAKRIPYVEALLVSSGFVLRLLAGSTAANTVAELDFIVVLGSTALLLVTCKRLAELVHGESAREVVQRYSPNVLRVVLHLLPLAGFVSMLHWIIAQGSQYGAITLATYSVLVFRIVSLGRRGALEEPEKLAHDRWALLAVVTGFVSGLSVLGYL